MKRCESKSKCKTAPNKLLSDASFEPTAGASNNLRGKCRKCRQRSSVRKHDAVKERECGLMYFMATMLWNEANRAAIYTRCSQGILL